MEPDSCGGIGCSLVMILVMIIGLGVWLIPIGYGIAVPHVFSDAIDAGLLPEKLTYEMAFRLVLANLVIMGPSLVLSAIGVVAKASIES
ncbi:MAG: hypothetical protein U9M89_02530 [Patescibacteria group bacterium]|nr:hypothetical protein [Patescibacteria group bacterium]